MDKSFLVAVLGMTELQYWWVTTPTPAISLMISNPLASVGSKINLKHSQREGDSLLEREIGSLESPIQQFLFMEILKGRKETVR